LTVVLKVRIHGVSLAANVQNEKLFRPRFGLRANGLIDDLATASAAEYQQHFGVQRDIELSSRLRFGDVEKSIAHGRAAVHSVANEFCRFGKGSEYAFAFICGEAVCKPQGKIAFVAKTGDSHFMRGKNDRQSNVSAFGKYGIRFKDTQAFRRFFLRLEKCVGNGKIIFKPDKATMSDQFWAMQLKIRDFSFSHNLFFDAVRTHIANVRIPRGK
jgi:hypothetical protein